MVAFRKHGKNWYRYWRENGNTVERVLAPTLEEAEEKAAGIERRLVAQRKDAMRKIPWEKFVEKYLTLSQAHWAKDTLIRHRVVFNNFNKALTIKMLHELTPESLERYKLIRKEKGVQPLTINREITTLKSAMGQAAIWGYAYTNIWGVLRQETSVLLH